MTSFRMALWFVKMGLAGVLMWKHRTWILNVDEMDFDELF